MGTLYNISRLYFFKVHTLSDSLFLPQVQEFMFGTAIIFQIRLCLTTLLYAVAIIIILEYHSIVFQTQQMPGHQFCIVEVEFSLEVRTHI